MRGAKAASAAEKPSKRARPRRRIARWLIGAALVVGLVGGAAVLSGLPATLRSIVTGRPRATPAISFSAPLSYVGVNACRECHQEQFRSWKGSHHDMAMQHATPDTVLGDFADASFDYFGTRTDFFKQDGRFMVRTDGPDGKPTEYQVEYTFGVFPLQQYLVAFPGGRYQAIPIAWDSRPKDAGGQRWFHLYPGERIVHTDQLHWTGRYQNWNLMCAECHSTNLRKGFDSASNTYRTTFSEINVACEACHGRGSQHVEWARRTSPPYDRNAERGLEVTLDSLWATAWTFSPKEPRFPARSSPPAPAALNVCAACHARRATLAEGVAPGAPLEDSHRLSLIGEPLYFSDGQQRDEVYEWGSFLQSRMYQKGVTCMDCHDAHSLKLHAPGNDVCARCHNPELFNTPKHHFHKDGGTGASCVACHMPTQKYMVIHERLDHSIRVPRPDLSAVTGAPDACTMCHTDRDAKWAATAMDSWYPRTWRDRAQWGPALAAPSTQGIKAIPKLMALAQDGSMPWIIRASAADALAAGPHPQPQDLARTLVADPEPSVRISGLALLDGADASVRTGLAGACLADPVRGVRLEAARVLADVPDTALPASLVNARLLAEQEYLQALRLNADWPAENVNAGNYLLRRGRTDDAISAFRQALALDPRFIGAYVNLADVYRQLGRDTDGERELRAGLALLPDSADLHHSLGLLLIRARNLTHAMEELRSATELAPENPRYSYVYAIGLHSSGNADSAISTLRAAESRHPFDPDILSALVSMLRERNAPGDRAAALAYARKLGEALPQNTGVQGLIRELEAGR